MAVTDIETDSGERANVHVYPLYGREHDIEHHLECWCSPYVDSDFTEQGGSMLIVHREEN